MVNPGDLNEIRTNLDTIYTALGITRPGCGSGAGWSSYWPIVAGYTILTGHPQQLRQVADYAYENLCPSDKSPHYIIALTDYDTGHCVVHDTSEKGSEYGTHWDVHDINEDSPHYGTHKDNVDTGALSDEYGTHRIVHHDAEDLIHDTIHRGTDYDGDLATDCTTNYVTVKYTHRIEHKSTEYGTHYYDEHSIAKDSEYSGHEGGHLSGADYGDDASALMGQYAYYLNNDHTTYYFDDDYNELSSYDLSHFTTYYPGNDSPYHGTHYSGDFWLEDGNEYGTYYGIHDSVDHPSYYPVHYIGDRMFHDSFL